ncbi:MAG: hypothetical protein HQM11_10150 [SAR324 cluster bacterium]|nr:hypothetical protein [SAR324 cluster bacterium]
MSLFKLGYLIKDAIHIIRLKKTTYDDVDYSNTTRLQGVPVASLGSLEMREAMIQGVIQEHGDLDYHFHTLIENVGEMLKAVGKHISTDIYLERSILQGARERDAHRYFLVQRREVDTTLLLSMLDRDKIQKLQKEWSMPAFAHPLIRSKWNGTGSVFDESYTPKVVRQTEHYFNLLFEESSIIHILDRFHHIIRVLCLPYELPETVYQRKPFPCQKTFSLTEWLLSSAQENAKFQE